jgi:hypothetical protein
MNRKERRKKKEGVEGVRRWPGVGWSWARKREGGKAGPGGIQPGSPTTLFFFVQSFLQFVLLVFINKI